jgi:hypothetical protein
MSLRIRNHGELHSAVLRATLAGGAYGLLHWRWPGPAGIVLGVIGVGIAAVPPRSMRSAMVAAVVAVLAGAASALGGTAGLCGLALVGGLTFARDLAQPAQRAIAAACGVAGLAAGWFVESALGLSSTFTTMPPAFAAIILGAAAGFVAALGTVGRQLEWGAESAPAAPVATPKPVAPQGELGSLLARANSAFQDAQSALGNEAPEARAAAQDLLSRIIRFSAHWNDLDGEATRTDRVALVARLDEITAREQAAKDDVVRAEYARARTALREQLDYLDGIERGRDRAVARLHHHIAVLERLRLAALHHRSADATRVGDELAPLVDDIAAAGKDLDYAAEALAELPAASS